MSKQKKDTRGFLDPEPHMKNLAETTREAVPWLWQGRVSVAAMTLIAGDPGLGKSMITLDLAARVSAGLPFPEEPAGTGLREKSGVVLLSGEDNMWTTITPRLTAMGADLSRIVCVNAVKRYDERSQSYKDYYVSLDRDASAVKEAMDTVKPCRLVVIDPITSFLGSVDGGRAQAVRTFLRALMDRLRNELSPAVVVVAHLNKTRRRNAMSGIAGAMSFAAVARTAWMVTKDPADRRGERKLFLPIKNNLGEDRGGLAFSVRPGDGSGAAAKAGGQLGARVVWEPGAVRLTADEALEPASDWQVMERHARAEAKVWLEEVLRGGPMAAREVYLRAGREGIARKTLERAKMELGVVGKKFAFTAPWSWYTPAALAAEATKAESTTPAMPEAAPQEPTQGVS